MTVSGQQRRGFVTIARSTRRARLLTVGLIGVEGEKTISVNRRDHSRPHRLAFGPPEQEASLFHGKQKKAG
jgi:hypothetical protein